MANVLFSHKSNLVLSVHRHIQVLFSKPQACSRVFPRRSSLSLCCPWWIKEFLLSSQHTFPHDMSAKYGSRGRSLAHQVPRLVKIEINKVKGEACSWLEVVKFHQSTVQGHIVQKKRKISGQCTKFQSFQIPLLFFFPPQCNLWLEPPWPGQFKMSKNCLYL